MYCFDRTCTSYAARGLKLASCSSVLMAMMFLVSTPALLGQTSPSDLGDQKPTMSLAQAQDAFQHGRAQQAIAALQQLAATNPPAPGANRELGIAYYRTGKLEEAEKSFAAAMAEDPKDAESEQMRGLTLYRLNRRAEAVPYLEHARQSTYAANVDVNYVLGRCYIDAKRLDDARAAFSAQYGLDAATGPAYLLLAQMLVREELPQLAAENAKAALRLSPNLALAHFILGKIDLAGGDAPHALQEFEEERKINPTYAPLYQFLGDLYTRTGQFQQAQHALTEALSLDQSSTGPFILMGKLFLEDRDPQTAVSYLEHAEQMDASNFITHYLLGRAYQQMGRNEDAKREMTIVANLHSSEDKSLQ